jgi:hypothetical protein
MKKLYFIVAAVGILAILGLARIQYCIFQKNQSDTIAELNKEIISLDFLYQAGIEKILPEKLKEEKKQLEYEIKHITSLDDTYGSERAVKRRRIEAIQADAEKHCPACLWAKNQIELRKKEIKRLQK